ncbi:hypothetical protein M5D96_002010 [Drosophila gunungcola]|uniref:Uncharacterized protein n=1 Tax=Drosophila gunungcola TaxID=103775 RepID=A0A9P9YZ65_9MUSC|nr:hypothetical protein M5D96_002010 [Drosophila gunungcola]
MPQQSATALASKRWPQRSQPSH